MINPNPIILETNTYNYVMFKRKIKGIVTPTEEKKTFPKVYGINTFGKNSR